MKILYDNQIFDNQQVGGISRYHVELLRQFLNVEDISCLLPFDYSNNEYLLALYASKTKYDIKADFNDFIWGFSFPGKNRLFNLRNHILPHKNGYIANNNLVINAIKESQFDLFHPTYYNPYFLDYIQKPFVLTVHDMVHEIFPDEFSESEVKTITKNKKNLIDACSHIIAVSENTKNDLIRLYGVSKSKISVIYLADSLSKKQTNKDFKSISEKYFIYVGKRDGYKNFNLLLNAFKEVNKKYSEITLQCIGNPFNEHELKRIEDLGLKGKIFAFFADDTQLSNYYSNAISLVFPSKYEGFGIPILEAMRNGCPVICGRTSSLPEVAGNAALYADLSSYIDFAEKMQLLIGNKDLADDIVRNGITQLANFSWEVAATKTKEVYARIIGKI